MSIVSQPSLFLTLSALKNENIDETLVLTDVVCLGHFLYILVETTIITTKEGNTNRRLRTKLNRRMRKRITLPNCSKSPTEEKPSEKQKMSEPPMIVTTIPEATPKSENPPAKDKENIEKPSPSDPKSDSDTNNDTSTTVPAWIEQELATSEEIPAIQNADSPNLKNQIDNSQSRSTNATPVSTIANLGDTQILQPLNVDLVDDGTFIQEVEGTEPLNESHDTTSSQFPSIYPDCGGGQTDAKKSHNESFLHSNDILSSSSGSEIGTVLKTNTGKDQTRPKIAFGDRKAYSQEKKQFPNINDGQQRVDNIVEIYGGKTANKKASSKPNSRQYSEKQTKGHHHHGGVKPKTSRGSAGKPLPTDQSELRGGSSKLPSMTKHVDESPSRRVYQEMQERLMKLESENKEMKENLKRMEGKAEDEKTALLQREMSQASTEKGLQDEVVGLRNDLKEALALNFRQLQTNLEDQMRRFQTEQSQGGRAATRAEESALSDSSISGDRPLTKESGYGTAKRKRAGGNRVEPMTEQKAEKSKICVVS